MSTWLVIWVIFLKKKKKKTIYLDGEEREKNKFVCRDLLEAESDLLLTDEWRFSPFLFHCLKNQGSNVVTGSGCLSLLKISFFFFRMNKKFV